MPRTSRRTRLPQILDYSEDIEVRPLHDVIVQYIRLRYRDGCSAIETVRSELGQAFVHTGPIRPQAVNRYVGAYIGLTKDDWHVLAKMAGVITLYEPQDGSSWRIGIYDAEHRFELSRDWNTVLTRYNEPSVVENGIDLSRLPMRRNNWLTQQWRSHTQYPFIQDRSLTPIRCSICHGFFHTSDSMFVLGAYGPFFHVECRDESHARSLNVGAWIRANASNGHHLIFCPTCYNPQSFGEWRCTDCQSVLFGEGNGLQLATCLVCQSMTTEFDWTIGPYGPVHEDCFNREEQQGTYRFFRLPEDLEYIQNAAQRIRERRLSVRDQLTRDQIRHNEGLRFRNLVELERALRNDPTR